MTDSAALSRILRRCKDMIDDDWPKGAVAMTKNLDLLVEHDEPLELAVALRKIAEMRANDDEDAKEWSAFAKAMIALVGELEALNQPGSASEAKSE